jgi:hypothetical protein
MHRQWSLPVHVFVNSSLSILRCGKNVFETNVLAFVLPPLRFTVRTTAKRQGFGPNLKLNLY